MSREWANSEPLKRNFTSNFNNATSASQSGGNTFRDETRTPSVSEPSGGFGRTRRMVIAGEQELDGNQQRWRDFSGRGGGDGGRYHPYGR